MGQEKRASHAPPTTATAFFSSDAPPAKKAKLAADDGAPADVAVTDAAPDAGTADAAADAPAPVDAPVQIGYKNFSTGAEAAKYFYTIINSVTHGQDLNEVRRKGG